MMDSRAMLAMNLRDQRRNPGPAGSDGVEEELRMDINGSRASEVLVIRFVHCLWITLTVDLHFDVRIHNNLSH